MCADNHQHSLNNLYKTTATFLSSTNYKHISVYTLKWKYLSTGMRQLLWICRTLRRSRTHTLWCKYIRLLHLHTKLILNSFISLLSVAHVNIIKVWIKNRKEEVFGKIRYLESAILELKFKLTIETYLLSSFSMCFLKFNCTAI